MLGEYVGKVRSIGTLAITDRSVNELPMPRLRRAMQMPSQPGRARLHSSAGSVYAYTMSKQSRLS